MWLLSSFFFVRTFSGCCFVSFDAHFVGVQVNYDCTHFVDQSLRFTLYFFLPLSHSNCRYCNRCSAMPTTICLITGKTWPWIRCVPWLTTTSVCARNATNSANTYCASWRKVCICWWLLCCYSARVSFGATIYWNAHDFLVSTIGYSAESFPTNAISLAYHYPFTCPTIQSHILIHHLHAYFSPHFN